MWGKGRAFESSANAGTRRSRLIAILAIARALALSARAYDNSASRRLNSPPVESIPRVREIYICIWEPRESPVILIWK